MLCFPGHFQFDVSRLEEYNNLAFDIIKKPEKVSTQLGIDGSLLIIFIRDNLVVVCQYDNYSAMAFYRISS